MAKFHGQISHQSHGTVTSNFLLLLDLGKNFSEEKFEFVYLLTYSIRK